MGQTNNDERTPTLLDDMFSVANKRDQAALARLFDHFVPRIRAFCLTAQPGSNLMADDIAQEVLIRIWNKAHTYNPESASLNTWVFTIARNARIDYLRKNGRYQTGIDPDFLWADDEDENADPFREAQQKRDQDTIRASLKQLPSDQRQVLAKVYLEGKTHKETSEELNIPLGTIKSRVRLALNKLTVIIRR
ncbi:sigma-70 family RNA polymerase sigma factor [Marinomonas balearica]|uniref:RNA polymerase sigma-70 factor (ECF subfamily) n=1 Tax=Marinomonas balearica TaxID=491947 RepID=A0A4R6M3H9_9GAMM|nr:sigma-70 family RNA polymerase sigma factor [Marinomonas balearica]TDO95848.1 RNA polymerase sigma-70 factor (ECF subfamily) [Marinomonas balearica]